MEAFLVTATHLTFILGGYLLSRPGNNNIVICEYLAINMHNILQSCYCHYTSIIIYVLLNVQCFAFQSSVQLFSIANFLFITYSCRKAGFEISQDIRCVSSLPSNFIFCTSTSHPDHLQHRSMAGWVWKIPFLLLFLIKTIIIFESYGIV